MRGLHRTIAVIFAILIAGAALAGAPNYADGVLLIRFHDDVYPTTNDKSGVSVGDLNYDRLLTRYNATDIQWFFGEMNFIDEEFMFDVRNDYIIQFPSGTDMEMVAHEFSQMNGIEWALPDYLIPLDYIPNDPSFGSQWFHENIESSLAWDIVTGSEDVLVAGIDTGVDWNHPDLVDNIWVNPGEDIDDNPAPYDIFDDIPGTSNDWNYEDDDGNGYADDFIGYDWVTGVNGAPGEDDSQIDNNPMDFNGHGTGVAAAMVETADNGTGGAGVAFGCKVICTRAGYQAPDGGGFTQTSAAVQAMTYLTDIAIRYDKTVIVNMSYGGSTPYGPMQTAVANAWNNNLLMFAAAGNDNHNAVQYPANYPNIIAVAATDQSDNRASFSNYGDWVDVASPGVGCFTSWFDNGYSSWDGTSVASPIAAGVGALVAARFPEQTNTYWSNVVINSVDIIDQSPTRPIGSGRVNAYQAVTQYYWPELTIESLEMTDPDGNYHPDPGETIEVRLTISNEEGWQDAILVNLALEFDNPAIEMVNGQVLLGNIESGTTADNNDYPLSFHVPDTGVNGVFTNMTVRLTCDPNEYEIAIDEQLLIGTPEVMFVDDDGGEGLDEYIRADLNALNMVFNHVDMATRPTMPETDEISGYPVVIWMTGNEEDPITSHEQELLEAAIDAGVNVFIFGEGIDEQLAGTDFYANYLHAESTGSNGAIALDPIEGAGGPVVDEGRLVLTGPGGASNSTNPDVINPVNGGQAAYSYYTSVDDIGGIYYESEDHVKLVYFAFAFEATSGAQESTSREMFLESLFAWFGTDVEEQPGEELIPEEFAIATAYPNPFNPSTTLQVSIPQNSTVSLRVFDILGREVATLAQGSYQAGMHSFQWNATSQASGVYFAVLEANGHRSMQKLVYMR